MAAVVHIWVVNEAHLSFTFLRIGGRERWVEAEICVRAHFAVFDEAVVLYNYDAKNELHLLPKMSS